MLGGVGNAAVTGPIGVMAAVHDGRWNERDAASPAPAARTAATRWHGPGPDLGPDSARR